MDSPTHLVLCLQESIDVEAILHKYNTPEAVSYHSIYQVID